MLPTYIFFKKWWSKIEIFGLEQSYGRREYIAKHFDDNACDLFPMYMHYVEETICCNMVDSWLCIDHRACLGLFYVSANSVPPT